MTEPDRYSDLFRKDKLDELFPSERADDFFDALLGDKTEGAYDISLVYNGHKGDTLQFELELKQRPGKCLRCNLTHGLPHVFARHPVINIDGLVQHIDKLLNGNAKCLDWKLGNTVEKNRGRHAVPLVISLEPA